MPYTMIFTAAEMTILYLNKMFLFNNLGGNTELNNQHQSRLTLFVKIAKCSGLTKTVFRNILSYFSSPEPKARR